ncbi:hypothetical protein [Rossellomorea sp. LjRoot5]|uniref:hypothetical protein n=1 Tax=Rossellomorea sp. LjRoot5 TaxID=3342331 RepID=UPI003ECE0616
MKKENFIFVFSMLVVITILLVSETSVEVMAFLGLLVVIISVPAIRQGIWKDNFRKVKAAFYTTVCFTIGLFIFYFSLSIFAGDSYSTGGELSLFVLVVFLFSLIGNVFYGLPVSLVAEYISIKFSSMRPWVSGVIHIGLGAITYFIFPGLSLGAISCAVIFFIIDEVLYKKSVLS